ncbi:MAG: PEP-CTERM sorting domain-containing protein [Verrucomicrobiia bacterium]
MKALSLVVASLVSWAGIVSAQNTTFTTTVQGNQGPWDYVNGGLNSAYQYATVYSHTSPTVINASDGISFSAGLSLSVSYVSGLVSVGSESGWPYTDANGDTAVPLNNENWDGGGLEGFGPSYYMNPATYPIYFSELVGTFANSSGQIVGTPFPIGDLGTFTIPTGATQLQLGVTDVGYGDNTGSWTVQIASVPEPTTTALVLIGLGGLGLTARRCRRSAVR